MARPLYDRDYILLLSANFLYSLYAILFIFLPPFLYRLGVREGEIGLLMATGTLTAVALRPVNAFFIERAGHVAFLVSGALLAAASTVPWMYARSPGAHLFALRIFQGAAYSFFSTAAYAFIAASAPAERRGEALGIFGLSFFVPFAIGGWLGDEALAHAGDRALFLATGAAAFLAGLVPLGIRNPARSSRLTPASLWVFLSRPYFVPNSAAFLFGMAHGSLFTFVPVYLLVRPVSTVSVFLVAYSAAVVGTRTLARRLADRMPRERLTVLSLVLLGGAIGAVPAVGGPVSLFLAGCAAGTGHGFLFPSLSALVIDRAGEEKGGMAMAMFAAAMDMGLVAGAAAFGFAAEHLGYTAMFRAAAVTSVVSALFFFALDPSFRKAAPPAPGK